MSRTPIYGPGNPGAAVKETSYYGPLANLLNEIGKTFKSKVKCTINLKGQGADLLDGWFFTQDQFPKFADTVLRTYGPLLASPT